MANNSYRVPRVLYFIEGMVPTDEQKADAARFGPNVGIRNALQVAELAMSPLEECDAVAGKVPPRYANVYPDVSAIDTSDRMLRMSDLDRPHGPVHSVDNEAARAAKPPAFGQDRVTTQGAIRPHGAFTQSGGGFVAPSPGNPNNIQAMGSERAENAPEGSAGEGRQGARYNPQGLPDAGVTLPATGSDASTVAGAVAAGGGTGGFVAPEPVTGDTSNTSDSGKKSSKKASSGDTGAAA